MKGGTTESGGAEKTPAQPALARRSAPPPKLTPAALLAQYRRQRGYSHTPIKVHPSLFCRVPVDERRDVQKEKMEEEPSAPPLLTNISHDLLLSQLQPATTATMEGKKEAVGEGRRTITVPSFRARQQDARTGRRVRAAGSNYARCHSGGTPC